MVRAGRLSERIEIVRTEIHTRDENGDLKPMYVTIVQTFAAVKEAEFSNDMIASQEDWKETLEFTIRYRPTLDIKNGDSVVWRGRKFEIISNPSVQMTRQEIKFLARWQG